MPNPYETKRYLEEYLFFHYGKPRKFCPFPFIPDSLLQFHERIRKECVLPIKAKGREPVRALDVGCAVGRFAFELSQVADKVIGVDNSRAFIQSARRMAKNRAAIVHIKESGANFSSHKIALPKEFRSSRVQFDVADAQDLGAIQKSCPSGFQIVAAINLLCRLPSPRKFLRQLPSLVAPGGQFVIASPYSWLPEYTPRREWMSPEKLESILSPHFRVSRRTDLPFMIREHRRKYQLVVSHVLTFARK